jgi:hypothetical protein
LLIKGSEEEVAEIEDGRGKGRKSKEVVVARSLRTEPKGIFMERGVSRSHDASSLHLNLGRRGSRYHRMDGLGNKVALKDKADRRLDELAGFQVVVGSSGGHSGG